MTLPDRTTSSTVGEHVADHNLLHDRYNLGLYVDADDTAATIQTKIDAGPVTFMEDVVISSTLRLTTHGQAVNLNGRQLQSSADPVFELDGWAEGWFGFGKIDALAGHCFRAVQVSVAEILSLTVEQCTGKSVWKQSDIGRAFDVSILGGHWELGENASVPALDVSVTGDFFAANLIAPKRITAYGSNITAPIIQIEFTTGTAGGYLYDNTFRDINFEQPQGGMIHAYSVNALRIEDCTAWDLHLEAITNDLIIVSSRAGCELSQGAVISGYHRPSGDLDGHYDIRAFEGSGIDTGAIRVIHPMGTSSAQLQLNVEAGSLIGGYRVTEN